MYRRVVSLLLVPCLLLTQSAALGHHHGGDQPPGHDLRPHVHTTPAPHDHEHHHGPGSHDHHDDGEDESETARISPSLPQPLSDHDDDAVYVTVEFVVAGRVQSGQEVERAPWLPPSVNAAPAVRGGLREWSAPWPHAPPWIASACPLYLLHLALLI
jgi:hypothetical protein